MSTLREIRRQIDSTANIRKITQAMEMVAASRLRRAQKKAEAARPYAEGLRIILENLIAVTGGIEHPLIQKRELRKIGLIVFAGDRGLCGGYNQAIFSEAESFLKKYRPKQVQLILFGRKAVDYFSGRLWPIGQRVADWGGKITYRQIEEFTQGVIQAHLTHEMDEVWLIYSHFINAAQRKIRIEKFLSLDRPEIQDAHLFQNTLIEPNATDMYEEIIPRYLVTKMQTALNESYASELAARIFAMRAATKNADEMIETLTVKRNKLRQATITRELIEIVSGAEHLKD